ncbi:tyrosine-type recombinase/integrase [Natrinema sp. H-ect4]|uniref:tyrosine-type recombinase/integrase n=1 Tax=Natrinema sp. H-ect4 TaxID=3242699 RepID=UPI0035A99E21
MSSALRSTNKTRHSKEDALDEREYELLLEGATRLDEPYSRETRFIVLVAGRLGLRLGEMTHMRESWVDWRKRMIEIPRHQGCDKGKSGGLCGLCKQQMRQQVAHNDDLEIEDVRPSMWRSKTDAAARAVPFDFDPRTELAIERFFDRHDRWPYSHTAIRRRVTKATAAADELEDDSIYPHALRATAASAFAARGLDVLPLQAMMGWANASTAECYVQQSPENTARALHSIHSR